MSKLWNLKERDLLGESWRREQSLELQRRRPSGVEPSSRFAYYRGDKLEECSVVFIPC
jgi:hypothetical protein